MWLWVTLYALFSAGAQNDLATIDGKYLRLITDLPASDSLRSSVAAFDEAVPLWLEYWNRDLSSVAGWRMTGYLMQDKSEFRKRDLIPDSLPDFVNGYQRGDQLWVVNQPSDYYSLHLLLHEGAHGMAQRLFGGAGPPWFMEGTAEFLATHERDEAGLRLGVIPASKESSPFWGRIGLISERRSEGKLPTIESVMRYSDVAHREVEPYAWSWAAALLMEMYPEYRQRFRAAALKGRDTSAQFTRQYYQSLQHDWPVLTARWQLLCDDLEYGFDRERNRVLLDPSAPFLRNPTSMKLMADQGWQAAPAKVRAGDHLQIDVTGQAQLRDDPAWRSGADGVTITYQRSLPLGRVVACVVPHVGSTERFLPKLQRFSVGASGELTVPQDGWLLLKINDFPGQLADNQGLLDVQIQMQLR